MCECDEICSRSTSGMLSSSGMLSAYSIEDVWLRRLDRDACFWSTAWMAGLFLSYRVSSPCLNAFTTRIFSTPKQTQNWRSQKIRRKKQRKTTIRKIQLCWKKYTGIARILQDPSTSTKLKPKNSTIKMTSIKVHAGYKTPSNTRFQVPSIKSWHFWLSQSIKICRFLVIIKNDAEHQKSIKK